MMTLGSTGSATSSAGVSGGAAAPTKLTSPMPILTRSVSVNRNKCAISRSDTATSVTKVRSNMLAPVASSECANSEPAVSPPYSATNPSPMARAGLTRKLDDTSMHTTHSTSTKQW